jgi:GAF domain-containing protein/two-component sensor histidine kinase
MQIGIAWRSMLKREIIVAEDVKKHPWFITRPGGQEFTSLMSVPIIDPATQFPLGTLSIYSSQPAAFTIEDQSTLMDLANQGAISLARVQRSEEWRLKGNILKEIFESTLEIDFEADEQTVAQQLASIARRILPFGMVRIRLYDPVSKELVGVAAAGYPEDEYPSLIGTRLPLEELQKFLVRDYQEQRSFLIPSNAQGWKEFAEQYLYIPEASALETATWDPYDAFFTPLYSKNGELLGYITWDQPESALRPTRRIVEVVGAFASMASWSIDLIRAYRRITEQRGLIGSLIASTTELLAPTRDSNVMNEIAVKGAERLSTEACSLFLVVENQLELASSTYLKNTQYIRRRKQIKAEPGSGLTSWVAATLTPLYFNSIVEYRKHLGWAGETEQLQHMPSRTCQNLLFVPIVSHSGHCVGVVSFENKVENGSISDFSDKDVRTAMNLAEELGLSLGLAEQFRNVRTLEQQMLEDDLHELKNHYYAGVQVPADASLYWLRKHRYEKAQSLMKRLFENSQTILNELYGLHNTVQRKYYEIENFREALNFMTDSMLQVFVSHDQKYRAQRSRVRIVCPRDIQLTPLMRYTLLRICSGALMNAIRHSGFLRNPEVMIRINVRQLDEDQIRLIVSDNGRGQKKINPGYGIGRMRYLVRFLTNQGFDIKLNIHSNDGKGTEVELTAGLTPKEV